MDGKAYGDLWNKSLVVFGVISFMKPKRYIKHIFEQFWSETSPFYTTLGSFDED